MTCRPSVAALSPHPAPSGWGHSWLVQAWMSSIDFGVPCVGCFFFPDHAKYNRHTTPPPCPQVR